MNQLIVIPVVEQLLARINPIWDFFINKGILSDAFYYNPLIFNTFISIISI